MATLFTKIIDGDIPGRFVWADEVVVAFGTIAPITDGHVLVVPRAEIVQLTDAPDDVLSHLMLVARTIGRAQQHAWDAPRAALLVAGFEVPHLHLHVLPAWDEASLTFANARPDLPPRSSTPPPSASAPPLSRWAAAPTSRPCSAPLRSGRTLPDMARMPRHESGRWAGLPGFVLDGPDRSKDSVLVLTDEQELEFLRYALQGVPTTSWTSNEIDWDAYRFLSRTGPFETAPSSPRSSSRSCARTRPTTRPSSWCGAESALPPSR